MTMSPQMQQQSIRINIVSVSECFLKDSLSFLSGGLSECFCSLPD